MSKDVTGKTIREHRIDYLEQLKEELTEDNKGNINGIVASLRFWNLAIKKEFHRGETIREFFEGRKTSAIGQGFVVEGKTSIFEDIVLHSSVRIPMNKNYSATPLLKSYCEDKEISFSESGLPYLPFEDTP
ncbi:hypothetical protein [Piscirickettsia salmonis]|uniref:hypothetical protein n=1 Tax=Piscirickettsia salmonis TaxID=1238 RepID=UPI003A8001E2